MSRIEGGLFWPGSLRGQLILGVALVHALMMALFIWDLTERQQHLLLQRQTEQAQALAESLAVSSAGWLAARDVAGLQEIIEAQHSYPELEFAMLLDLGGQILAHSESSHAGRYVRDLPQAFTPMVVSRSAALVDVFSPVQLGGRGIGWVRIGIGQRIAGDRLAQITRDGLLYALAAILIGSLLAGWMGTRLTRKLYAIRQVTDAVSQGAKQQRVPPQGRDEAGALALDFNAMLDRLDQRDADLARTNHEMVASEARQRALINAMPDLVWLKDPDGIYLFCNPRFERFFGAVEAKILGRTDYDFVPTELADAFRDNDRKAMLAEQPCVNEEWITFADDGHRELVETIKTPLHDPDGGLMGVLGIARDITERKRGEDLQRYAAFQAGVAEMSVSVLHNIGNAVTAMSDDAHAVQQAGNDFARLADLLARSAEASQIRQSQGADAGVELARLLAIQQEAARTIGQLVEQVLQVRSHRIAQSVQHIADIVRIQQTSALPNASTSTFDLAQAIQNALNMQGDTLLQHNIQIDVEIDPSLRRVTLSHNQLLQALVNGVKNAYESIRLRQLQESVAGLIRLRAVRLGENRMRLSIEDNGAGIAPEQRANLFRFGYSTKARGSGFGLHSTALFVQEMGGSIALNSDGPNHGACLVLELPCGNVEANLRSSN
jgi:PAS domain S-box-containing protein